MSNSRAIVNLCIGITIACILLGSYIIRLEREEAEKLREEVVSLNELLEATETYEEFKKTTEYSDDDLAMEEYFDEDDYEDDFYDDDYDEYDSSEVVTEVSQSFEGTWFADNYVMKIEQVGPGYEFQGSDASDMFLVVIKEIEPGAHGYYIYNGVCDLTDGGSTLSILNMVNTLWDGFDEESVVEENMKGTIKFDGDGLRWNDTTNGTSMFFVDLSS